MEEIVEMDFIISNLEQGLIYGILGLGVYITYKILDFPDLTTDGSFPLGAAISAAMISSGISAQSGANRKNGFLIASGFFNNSAP